MDEGQLDDLLAHEADLRDLRHMGGETPELATILGALVDAGLADDEGAALDLLGHVLNQAAGLTPESREGDLAADGRPRTGSQGHDHGDPAEWIHRAQATPIPALDDLPVAQRDALVAQVWAFLVERGYTIAAPE